MSSRSMRDRARMREAGLARRIATEFRVVARVRCLFHMVPPARCLGSKGTLTLLRLLTLARLVKPVLTCVLDCRRSPVKVRFREPKQD